MAWRSVNLDWNSIYMKFRKERGDGVEIGMWEVSEEILKRLFCEKLDGENNK